MKSKVLSFLSGSMVVLILIVLPAAVLAASNGFTIVCYSIKMPVIGEVFQLKDTKSNDSLVFVLQQHDLPTIESPGGGLQP